MLLHRVLLLALLGKEQQVREEEQIEVLGVLGLLAARHLCGSLADIEAIQVALKIEVLGLFERFLGVVVAKVKMILIRGEPESPRCAWRCPHAGCVR